jgi:hypothetical protein
MKFIYSIQQIIEKKESESYLIIKVKHFLSFSQSKKKIKIQNPKRLIEPRPFLCIFCKI